MSKAVMLSIKPHWCELIANGKKTIEVRKTRPKLATPFKCYIYETKGKITDCRKCKNDDCYGDLPWDICFEGKGKILGEFVCDTIERRDIPYPAYQSKLDPRLVEQSCVRYFDLHRYAYHDDLYFWHISDLKIYDKPRELSDYRKPCVNEWYCESCAMYNEQENWCGNASLHITRPPQSWCYVEDTNG